jgi:hypothetical protein
MAADPRGGSERWTRAGGRVASVRTVRDHEGSRHWARPGGGLRGRSRPRWPGPGATNPRRDEIRRRAARQPRLRGGVSRDGAGACVPGGCSG